MIFSNAWAGKEQCQKYREKLLNIQKQQRSGYTLKQGEKLALKEDKARKAWWACEADKSTKVSSTSKRK